uniref:Uncharacterized protein n=1 Tax=Anopheles minimus TaxID=112268 RepID=A0A182VTU5_9DIPT
MEVVYLAPHRWTLVAVILLLTICHNTTTGFAVGDGIGKQVATVASGRHTASDHVREILGHVFGRDDRSYSGSHSSSTSDERSEHGDRWGRKRDTCRYVSRSGKFCKCNCYDPVSCHGTTTDREDIGGSKDTALATFLQPLEARLRDDQTLPERRSRELSYFGTGYNYNPYAGHHNPLYTPYSQQGIYSPYSNPAYGYGGGAAGFGGFGGGNGAFYGAGAGGYPGAQFGYSGFGQGVGAYPYGGGGWNAGQSPYAGYGSQLGGYYNRGLYVKAFSPTTSPIMKPFCSLLVLVAMVSLAVAFPAEQQPQQEPSERRPVVQLVPVEESVATVPEALETEGQRSKRHLGFGGVGIGVGVGLVGGGFGGYPGGYGGYGGYGGGFHPGYGYGGYYPGFGYGGYRRYGYRYGGYGYGGGFGNPYFF